MVNSIIPKSAIVAHTTKPTLVEPATKPLSIDDITSIDQIDSLIKDIDKDVLIHSP